MQPVLERTVACDDVAYARGVLQRVYVLSVVPEQPPLPLQQADEAVGGGGLELARVDLLQHTIEEHFTKLLLKHRSPRALFCRPNIKHSNYICALLELNSLHRFLRTKFKALQFWEY